MKIAALRRAGSTCHGRSFRPGGRQLARADRQLRCLLHLELRLIGDFQPDFGDLFPIVTAAAISGRFATVDNEGAPLGPSPEGWQMQWLVDYGEPTAVRLLIGVLGDVDGDGAVNGLDVSPFVDLVIDGRYQVAADMNADGSVNGLDIDPFVAAVVGGGLVAVPEPATLTLAVLGLLQLVGWRRHRQASGGGSAA